jgi:16S rRNA (uracil1498-N3)-methyltransferase
VVQRRLFVTGRPEKGTHWKPDAAALRYVARVLRTKAGDLFEGFGSDGILYDLEWVSETQGFHVVDHHGRAEKDGPLVALAVGLPKGPKFDQIIRQCTEAGVDAFFPVLSERSQVRLDEDEYEPKRSRWDRVLQEASRQSGRTQVPYLEHPLAWKDALNLLGDFDLSLMPHPGASMSLKSVLETSSRLRRILVMTGPEGGWSEKESTEAERRGARLVSLPVPVLRAETAPLAAVSMVRYHFSNPEVP